MSRLLLTLLKVPVLGGALRLMASSYQEGTTVTIRHGRLSGLKWRRYHRHVNGYWAGIYEPQLQDVLAHQLMKGGTFYDVGANAGFFSLLAAREVGSEGKVYSFEPIEQNALDIQDQMSVNGFQNCEVIRAALSNYCGKASMFMAGHSSMGYIKAADEKDDPGSQVSVEVTTLDRFAAIHEPADLIKIDVEGEEARVLEGANGLLASSRPPSLIIELHGDEVGKRVIQILKAAGYNLMDLHLKAIDIKNNVPSHLLAVPGVKKQGQS